MRQETEKFSEKKVSVTDGAFGKLFDAAQGGNTIKRAEDFFDDTIDMNYKQIEKRTMIEEKELSECIKEPRYMDILGDLACEEPEWRNFYEKDVSAESLRKLALSYYNWDDGSVIPYMIITHKNCDKSTAMAIFEHGDGQNILKKEGNIKPWESEWLAFFKALRFRIDCGILGE